MEGNTPRTLIRGVLQSSEAARSSPRRAQSASSSSSTTTGRRLSTKKSLPTSRDKPISSEKVSSSVKRPARSSLTNDAKRRRSLPPTPAETITPRTNIRAFLAAANTKTPEESSETRASHYRVTRSAISDHQVQKLISSETRSRRTTPRKRISQSFQTPRDSITPREAIRTYLNAANTEPQRRRITPNKRNTAAVDEEDSSEENQKDFETATHEDDPAESGVGKNESGNESGEPEDKGAESGVQRIESGDEIDEPGGEEVEHMNNVESGDGKVESEGEKDEYKEDNKYESSHEATADSSQDEHEMVGGRNKSDQRKAQDSSEEEISSQNKQNDRSAVNQSRRIVSLQEGESSDGTDTANWSARAGRSARWAKLRTPVLPDTTIAKATPVILKKPPVPVQQKKSRVKKNTPGKQKQAKNTKTIRNGSPVIRLPSNLVAGIFRHFSALKVSKEALEAVQVGSDAFFEQISTDLQAYCNHAKRKTIEESDVELLMRRQGLVKSKESFHALIEKYLPLEYRQQLIPTAKSGNKVVPKEKT